MIAEMATKEVGFKVDVDPELRRRFNDSVGKIPNKLAMTRLLKWFVAQPVPIQKLIMGDMDDPEWQARIARMLLEKMAAQPERPGKGKGGVIGVNPQSLQTAEPKSSRGGEK